MKKFVSMLLCVGILAGALSACKSNGNPADTETEPPFVLETEEEAESEETVYPYDNTHAYIFAYSDKRTQWTTNDLDASAEFHLLRLRPTGGDPIVQFDFTGDEQVPTAEYPYVAFRYKATTAVTRGLFYVVTDLHTDYPDSSMTWFDVDTSGEWANRIYNMKEENGCWEGTLTTFRIDPINGEDLGAEIYLDRVGFFKTEADAQAFLDAAEVVDRSVSFDLSAGYSEVFLPAGTVSADSAVSDFTMADTSLAPQKDGITPLVGLRSGNTVTPVPVSYVNGAGYITYMAEAAGEYVLHYPAKNPTTDSEFVLIRGIMDETMLGLSKVTMETVWTALRNTQTERVDQPVSAWAASVGMDTSDPARGASATDISKAIYAYLNHLDADVYVDPDYYPAPNAIKAIKVAVGSGIITDITDRSLSGEELASVMTRLVKALLGQPVLPSKIEENSNSIKIGGWSGTMTWGVNDADIKTLADCGMNLLVSRGDIDALGLREQILQSGLKYGVETLFYDYTPWSYDMNNPPAIPTASYKYYDFDSYAGNHVFDEPGSDFFGVLTHLANRYHDALPGKTCFYNLLPMYANAAQLKYGAGASDIDYYDSDPDLYRKYVEDYAQNVPGDYICVDIYALGTNGNRRVVTYADYMKNMDIFGSVCREYDRDFWLYIQSYNFDEGGTWRADYKDYSLQMYTGLSFGVNTFIYFTYGSYNVDDALVDAEGKPTEQYDDARQINNEIMAFSDEYMQYRNLGAFNMNCEKGPYKYARFDNQYTDFSILKSVDSDDALLFGCFEKEEGEGYAFTVLNLISGNDRDRSTEAGLTFTLEGEHTVYAWIKGERVELTPEGGVYSLNLDVAEGAFVTID